MFNGNWVFGNKTAPVRGKIGIFFGKSFKDTKFIIAKFYYINQVC